MVGRGKEAGPSMHPTQEETETPYRPDHIYLYTGLLEHSTTTHPGRSEVANA